MQTVTAPKRTMGVHTTTDMARWTPCVRIRGRSMLPTLAHGQILVTRPACGYFAKGDVVVFTTATGHLYVKRIAGMPGDLVALEAGRLSVNGRAWDDGVPTAGAQVGDNLQESDDSRVWREPFVALARVCGVGLKLPLRKTE